MIASYALWRLRNGAAPFGFLGFDLRRIRSRRDRWMPLRTRRVKERTVLLRTLRPVFRSQRSRAISEVIAHISAGVREQRFDLDGQ